jgi:transcriptional regulator with XRE-family HTH domain
MNTVEFGALVRARRDELRIDQRTLGSLANVAVHTISNIELGRGNPTLSVVSRLLDVLGLDLTVRPRSRDTAK